MPLQPLDLLLGLDLAQRLVQHRQQALGRQLVDQLRLGLVEARLAQPVVQLGVRLDQRVRRLDRR